MRITSMSGVRYFVTFIDDFLKKVWLYMSKSKRDCFKKFNEFKAFTETQSEY